MCVRTNAFQEFRLHFSSALRGVSEGVGDWCQQCVGRDANKKRKKKKEEKKKKKQKKNAFEDEDGPGVFDEIEDQVVDGDGILICYQAFQHTHTMGTPSSIPRRVSRTTGKTKPKLLHENA